MAENETHEVVALYEGVQRILGITDTKGRKVGDCKYGVYLFLDYDEEPIYVGQTREQLRVRIGRHLTGQRSDAVAKNVLDPFEVAEIEMWPFWDLADSKAKEMLNRAEYTVYQSAVRQSQFGVVLNENEVADAELVALPQSVRGSILSGQERQKREHPDVRLARRAQTIANLARVISERKVSVGIRKTLLAQAQRLERLARVRLEELET